MQIVATYVSRTLIFFSTIIKHILNFKAFYFDI